MSEIVRGVGCRIRDIRAKLIGVHRRDIGVHRRFKDLWVTELSYAAFFGGAEKAPAAFIAETFASS